MFYINLFIKNNQNIYGNAYALLYKTYVTIHYSHNKDKIKGEKC